MLCALLEGRSPPQALALGMAAASASCRSLRGADFDLASLAALAAEMTVEPLEGKLSPGPAEGQAAAAEDARSQADTDRLMLLEPGLMLLEAELLAEEKRESEQAAAMADAAAALVGPIGEGKLSPELKGRSWSRSSEPAQESFKGRLSPKYPDLEPIGPAGRRPPPPPVVGSGVAARLARDALCEQLFRAEEELDGLRLDIATTSHRLRPSSL